MPVILLSGRELAERLGVTYATVMDWARMEQIPSLKTGRGRRLFNLDQVADALRERQRSRGPGLAVVNGGE